MEHLFAIISNYGNIAQNNSMSYQGEHSYYDYEYETHAIQWKDMSIPNKIRTKFIGATFRLTDAVIKRDNSLIAELDMPRDNNEPIGEPPKIIKKFLLPLLVDTRHEVAFKGIYGTDKNVSMVWGKAHIPYFIDEFEKNGYSIINTVNIDSDK